MFFLQTDKNYALKELLLQIKNACWRIALQHPKIQISTHHDAITAKNALYRLTSQFGMVVLLAQMAQPDMLQLQHVWLCHLSEENNHPELARKTVEGVLRSYGIVVGADLDLGVLKRNTPTGIFDLE